MSCSLIFFADFLCLIQIAIATHHNVCINVHMNIPAYVNETSLCCLDMSEARARLTAMPDRVELHSTAAVFRVLGDRTRVRILALLRHGPLCVKDLTALLDLNQTTVSHQLRVLRRNRLVRYEKDGKMVIYRLDDQHVESLLDVAHEHVREAGAP